MHADTTKAADTKKNFFPVYDYLKSEIAFVDSFPLRIIHYHTDNGKTDSSFTQFPAFNQMAREFLDPALMSPDFENDFSETSFLDQTSQSLTFTYSSKNSRTGLRRVDVLATPGLGFDKVKSIYEEKITLQHDTSIIKKLYWKARRNFQVITITQVGSRPAVASQSRVVWDNQP